MKKFLLLLAACIIAAATALSGCGVYNPATNPPGPDIGEKPNPQPPVTGEEYTVKIIYGNQPFTELEDVKACWTGEGTIVTAEFGEDGVARTNLDGDYAVTLKGLPEKYVYDANAYSVTSDNRDAVIELYKITVPRKTGSNWYTDAIEITEEGVFATKLNKATSLIRFIFAPDSEDKAGEYVIESWCSVTENNVNPTLRAHQGNRQFVKDDLYIPYEDGGYSGSYTKNFKYNMTFAKENIGSTYQFSISATTKLDYPVNITFAIRRVGDWDLGLDEAKVILPTEQWKVYPSQGRLYTAAKNRVFDMRDCELRDGYWWYCVDKENNDWRMLYAYITAAAKDVFATPLTRVEDYQNALTVSNGTESYKYFIRGSEVGMEYPLPPEGWQKDGYADHVNTDGVYPVTDELKIFLQKFSEAQMLFFDGDGIVDGLGWDAYENSQWMFACAYYG